MKVDKETLQKIAHLSRLKINEEDEGKIMEDMTKIITWVEQLGEIDTEGVQPLTSMSHEVNMMREDVVQPHLDHEHALKYAPKKDSDYFRVPKVLE